MYAYGFIKIFHPFALRSIEMPFSLQTVMKILYIPNQRRNSTGMTWTLTTKFQIEVKVFPVVDLIYLYVSAITKDDFKKESEFFLCKEDNSHSIMILSIMNSI